MIKGAALRGEQWAGYADLLIHSSVDPWGGCGYSVCEIKLASGLSPDYILQTGVYAHILNDTQKDLSMPLSKHAYICLGKEEPEVVPVDFITFLYKRTEAQYNTFLTAFQPQNIPEPDRLGVDMQPWSAFAERMLIEKDSLKLIANIRRSQVRQIIDQTGMSTLTSFAEMDSHQITTLIRSRKLSPAYEVLHKQARLQLQTRQTGRTAFEIVQHTGASIPVEDADLYFDIEGFPLFEGGLEYLFGISDRKGRFSYWWAHTREEEETAFVRLINYFQQQLEGVIFHYGHYEITALQRISRRVTTKDGFKAAQYLEELIDNQRFFDVYNFVRSALIVGEQSYSIKKIEKLVGVSREDDDLADAQSSVGMYYQWRQEIDDFDQPRDHYPSHQILDTILQYNRQDCESLSQVVAWLRQKFPDQPPILSDVSDDDDDQDTSSDKKFAPGACGRGEDNKQTDSDAIIRSNDLSVQLQDMNLSMLQGSAKSTLSHLLQFYVRESSPARRAFRERLNLAGGNRFYELFKDQHCLTDLRFLKEIDAKSKQLYVYSFNRREPTTLTTGDSCAFVVPVRGMRMIEPGQSSPNLVTCFMTIKFIDRSTPTPEIILSISGSKEKGAPPFGVLVSTEDLKICDAPLRQSVLRKAEGMLEGSSNTLSTAFLNRTPITEEQNTALFQPESLRDNISDFLASTQRPGVLVIQGPPGSGKTYLSSRIIFDLIMKHGKTVAISSNSHTAIDKLLLGSIKAGTDRHAVIKVGKRPDKDYNIKARPNARDLEVAPVESETSEPIEEFAQTSGKGRRSTGRRHKALVGATCYQLSQEICDDKFDFLFIDEASQVTVANFLSMAGCAKYAVLVGDQQQLDMPIQGAHPGDAGLSCLSYAVGDGVSIVSKSHGVFLDKSYRMNPQICSFVSNAFYNDALKAAPNCSKNELRIQPDNASLVKTGSGILFIPSDQFVPEANGQTVQESGKWHKSAEVEVLTRVVNELLGCEYTIGNENSGRPQRISMGDILVVAPYNMQVRALQAALPEGIRIGTVDRFQGQEAPVVLVSSCASDSLDSEDDDDDIMQQGNDQPRTWASMTTSDQRSLRFSLKKNRLNVAISRAQCLAIVTGQQDACARMPLHNLKDIEVAALYESLQTQ